MSSENSSVTMEIVLHVGMLVMATTIVEISAMKATETVTEFYVTGKSFCVPMENVFR